MDPLTFDLAPQEVPVRIGAVDYVLREPTAAAAAAYRNACIRGAKMEDGKVVGIDGVADAEPNLVADCLYEKLPDGGTKNTSVPRQIVHRWPSRIIKQLFEKVREMGLLDDAETPEALEKQRAKIDEKLAKLRAGESAPKASPGPTTDTST